MLGRIALQLPVRVGFKPCIAALALALGACANTSPPPSAVSPEAQVEERSMARWAARIAEDVQAEYAFQSPAYRALFSPQAWLAQQGRGLIWQAAEPQAVSCEPDVCTVRVRATYVFRNPLPFDANAPRQVTLKERWVRLDGAWWFAHQR